MRFWRSAALPPRPAGLAAAAQLTLLATSREVLHVAGELPRWRWQPGGLLALTVAALNIKDYFFFKRGISLTIPESRKPRLFERMRHESKTPRQVIEEGLYRGYDELVAALVDELK